MKIPKELEDVFRGVELTEDEIRTLTWIAGWESQTVENLRSAIRKAQGTALSTLQAESEKLRAELEYEKEHANAYYEECGQWEAENTQLRAELEQASAEITRLKYYEEKCHDCPIVCAKTEIIKAHEELETVKDELERVKAERDAAVECINTVYSYILIKSKTDAVRTIEKWLRGQKEGDNGAADCKEQTRETDYKRLAELHGI